MIILGLVLLVVGILLGIPILYYIGAILIVLGIVLFVAGGMGHTVGGRRYWY